MNEITLFSNTNKNLYKIKLQISDGYVASCSFFKNGKLFDSPKYLEGYVKGEHCLEDLDQELYEGSGDLKAYSDMMVSLIVKKSWDKFPPFKSKNNEIHT